MEERRREQQARAPPTPSQSGGTEAAAAPRLQRQPMRRRGAQRLLQSCGWARPPTLSLPSGTVNGCPALPASPTPVPPPAPKLSLFGWRVHRGPGCSVRSRCADDAGAAGEGLAIPLLQGPRPMYGCLAVECVTVLMQEVASRPRWRRHSRHAKKRPASARLWRAATAPPPHTHTLESRPGCLPRRQNKPKWQTRDPPSLGTRRSSQNPGGRKRGSAGKLAGIAL